MSFFDEFDELFKKINKMKGQSSGYSISVVYGPDGKPVVNVETYGDVDKMSLKKEIEKMYPDSEVRGLDDEPMIREVKSNRRDSTVKKEGKKKPLIWEDDEE